MREKSKSPVDKKNKISIYISQENYETMNSEMTNKSKLINWLLEQYFNSVDNGN
jgi:hypothetical protein